MNVPGTLWLDAVPIAYYLINQVSSSIIGRAVPASLLYPNMVVFPISLHVFGCVCFVHQFLIDKLSLFINVHLLVTLGPKKAISAMIQT